ncbi:MAG: IS21-like element helper ATPase IstB [Gammaproteobacteria bacterium]|nr:IS21-like element helper ATPase IstB [Gammaproteobacteria bacterium]
MTPDGELKAQASTLKLYGLLAHWDELVDNSGKGRPPWIKQLIEWEVVERHKRGLERRLNNAHLGRFKPLADFDWEWPELCDRAMVSELMSLAFIDRAANIILVGPNGVGKSTIAQNIAQQAVIQGHTALFVNAAQMLNDLASQDGDSGLRRRLRHYSQPQVLVIDEVGYLSYGNRHADLLFEIINRRYEEKSTIVTTNRPFGEWNEVFPNAACVVSLVDRLVHHSDIVVLEGKSYRMKEANEQARKKQQAKAAKRQAKASTKPTDKEA